MRVSFHGAACALQVEPLFSARAISRVGMPVFVTCGVKTWTGTEVAPAP